MLAGALFCIACVVFWVWYQRNVRPDEPPLFTSAWPILGHLPFFCGNRRSLWHKCTIFSVLSYKLGGVTRIRVGPKTVYVVTSSDDILTLANTYLEKSVYYDFGKPWLGEGLLTGKVLTWKKHRKFLSPAFGQPVINTFIDVFNSQSRKLVKNMEVNLNKGRFDHEIYIQNNSLETICLTVLGVTLSETLSYKCSKAMELFTKSALERLLKFWWHSPYTFRFSNLKKKQDAYIKELHSLSTVVLQSKRSKLNENISEELQIPDNKFKTYLDLLVELSQEGVFNKEEIRGQLDTIIAAGIDTTANCLMFTLVLLGSYTAVQENVFEEIKEIFGDDDRDVDKEDLPKLVYLEAVIKESLRLYTVVPLVARAIDKDIKFKNYNLYKGRTCCFALFAIHRHPVWGPDREQFRPERWLDSSQLPDDPNAFVAFGVGRRMCIGKTYALTSLKTTLVHLIRYYRINADDSQIKLTADVTMKAQSGHFISIEKRTRSRR